MSHLRTVLAALALVVSSLTGEELDSTAAAFSPARFDCAPLSTPVGSAT